MHPNIWCECGFFILDGALEFTSPISPRSGKLHFLQGWVCSFSLHMSYTSIWIVEALKTDISWSLLDKNFKGAGQSPAFRLQGPPGPPPARDQSSPRSCVYMCCLSASVLEFRHLLGSLNDYQYFSTNQGAYCLTKERHTIFERLCQLHVSLLQTRA